MREKKTPEGSRTPNQSRKKHDRADEKQVLPYKKRVPTLGSNDAQKVRLETSCVVSRQSSSSDTKVGENNKSEIRPSKKMSSSTTLDKDEVSTNMALQELRDPSGTLQVAMVTGNEGSVKKTEGDKIPVKGTRSVRIRSGNQSGIISSDLPPCDGVSKDGGSGVGDTKQPDNTKVTENEVGDDGSNGEELRGGGHDKISTPGAVGDRKKANDARRVVGKRKQASKGKGVMKQGGNGRSTGSEPQGDGDGDGNNRSPVFVDGKQIPDKIKEVIEYEGGRGGGNTGSEPADGAKEDEPGSITGDGKEASKRKEVVKNKAGGGGSTRCEPHQGDNDCKYGTARVVGDRKKGEKIKVKEHGGCGFLPTEMVAEGMKAGICEGDHEKQELTGKEDGGSEDNSNSAPGSNKDLLEYVVSAAVYANEPDVVEHGKGEDLANRVTDIEGSNNRLPADGTLTQSLDLEDGSYLSPAEFTGERDKNGTGGNSFHEVGQLVVVEDASENKNNRNMEPGREEEKFEGKKTLDDVVSIEVRDEVETEGGQDGNGNEADMIIGDEEKTHEADPVTKLVGSGMHSPADTTIKTRNDDDIEGLYEQKKNLTEDSGNEGGVIINELVEQDIKGRKTVDRYVISTIINNAGNGSGVKESEGGHDSNDNPPDVGNNGGKLKEADQLTNSAGCDGNVPPTSFTLGRGGDANTEGNHEELVQKASFLLPDGGRGTDSSASPTRGTPSHYIVNSSGDETDHGISNIQMFEDAKTISSGRKRTYDSYDQGEVSQDRAGGDATGQKGRKKYKEGSNEVSGININALGCIEPPVQQASHTFRLFGVDIDVPRREITITHVGDCHGGGESSMKKRKVGLRLMGYDI